MIGGRAELVLGKVGFIVWNIGRIFFVLFYFFWVFFGILILLVNTNLFRWRGREFFMVSRFIFLSFVIREE